MSNETKDMYNYLYASSYLYEDDHKHDHKIINPHDSVQGPSAYGNFIPTSFNDCLHSSSADYESLEKAFGLFPSSPEVFSSIYQEDNDVKQYRHDEGGNIGAATESIRVSVSCNSSNEADHPDESCRIRRKREAMAGGGGGDEEDCGGECSKKAVKAKKSEETKRKEPRVAFMTKSEVEHLEDGYRWRKYGQKAVKNSPYPRCTTQRCNVKKRVERSYQDPTVVITTYEGQHNHPIPTNLRGSSAAGMFSGTSADPRTLAHDFLMRRTAEGLVHGGGAAALTHGYGQSQSGGGGGDDDSVNVNPSSQQHSGFSQGSDYGLLKEILPSLFFKHEP
ncbi:PREDICTED: probable WRKY transcription factor 28 isoform X2 [Tarenaya hassleriana]|uniref:probable WRKY transcription factor 28 isoform X2 n=1 Tax=Tarenaya hassleriana TaxID=28532 RepID=UPI00053CA426|nr:PREDICTED: probable WRKY transcription factor 28 isoform X2 [Tarenaya hassleriana]